MTPAQEKLELATWISRAIEFFDRAAESSGALEDPAALYAEGVVILRRLQQNDNR